MSERCNNSACFSVEIKGTSDICVTFVVYACGISGFPNLTVEPATIDEIVVFTSKKGDDYE